MKFNTAVILSSLLSLASAHAVNKGKHQGKGNGKPNNTKSQAQAQVTQAANINNNNNNNNNNAAECVVPTSTTSSCVVITTTIIQAAGAATGGAAAPAASAATGTNIQKFTGSLGGPPPPVISSAGSRPFSVKGDTFVGSGAALTRSCDIQHNACANAANSGQLAGGVAQCDAQNTACKQANIIAARRKQRRDMLLAKRALEVELLLKKRQSAALDLGTCSDATIVFKEGLDGRNQAAFIASNQKDFNHGSALNIGVIAGFICQRLGSPCNAPADVQASCAQASSAAVAATQNQAAADAFNAIMGGGRGNGGGATATAAPTATATGNANNNNNNQACDAPATTAAPDLATVELQTMVMTITSCT